MQVWMWCKMSSIRPIPRKLLIHTITYKEYTGGDGWGDDYAADVEVKNVRVEPSSSMTRNSNQEEIIGEYVLIIDGVNSSPFINPKEKDKIVFDNKELEVGKVQTFYALSNKVHHIEAELK